MAEEQHRLVAANPSEARQKAFLVLLTSVALNAAGQVMFKSARMAQLEAPVYELFLRPQIWIALFFYGLSAISWLWVLSRAQLSYAYPVLALSFPIVVGLSVMSFNESISPLNLAGVALIVLGVSLLART